MTEKTYRIGEAADILELKTYVLRFWETEFPQLAPLRTEKGQRLYTERDLRLLRRIRQLLHEQGMTIEGARRVLAAERHGEQAGETVAPGTARAPGVPADGPAQEKTSSAAVGPLLDTLRAVREELLQLRRMLAARSAASSHHEDTQV